MSLPVMAPGCDERGVQTAWDTVWMARCWINGCSKSIRSDTGLCDECIEELRYETNKEGTGRGRADVGRVDFTP